MKQKKRPKSEDLSLNLMPLLKIPVSFRNKDIYAENALQNRIKYCRIIRITNKRGKAKFKLQLVLEGLPPVKVKETGEIRHYPKEGIVGLDLGVSTVACVSNNGVVLEELGSTVVLSTEKELTKLQRHLDRQRRANNPNVFNSNGTVKRERQKHWNISKRMKKTLRKISVLKKKRAVRLQTEHTKLAYRIIETLGITVITEKMQFVRLSRRTKKTVISDGKFRSKKRFGKSIGNHAPKKFLIILKKIAEQNGGQVIEVDTKKVKASQYNHISDKYELVSLSTRTKELSPGITVQRDLYSAFLLCCCGNGNIDKEKCKSLFESFYQQQTQLMSWLSSRKRSGEKFPSCMGVTV